MTLAVIHPPLLWSNEPPLQAWALTPCRECAALELGRPARVGALRASEWMRTITSISCTGWEFALAVMYGMQVSDGAHLNFMHWIKAHPAVMHWHGSAESSAPLSSCLPFA